MNRRNFLKLLGIGAVGAAVGRVAPDSETSTKISNPELLGTISGVGFMTGVPEVNFISRYRYEPLTKIPDDITFFTRPENRPPTHHA